MKKRSVFLFLLLIALVLVYSFDNKPRQVKLAEEFLHKNYSTSTLVLKEDFNEMNTQLKQIYGKYFTQKGFQSAFTNRAIAVGDILKSQGNILKASCKSIKLDKTNNKCEYAYSIILDVKLTNNQSREVSYNGVIRFSDENSKLIDFFNVLHAS